MQNSRVRFVFIIELCIAILIVGTLFSKQIVNGKFYSQKSLDQYVGAEGNSYERGDIMFSTSEGESISAATVEHGYKISIVPQEIKDISKTYKSLSNIILLDEKAFTEKAKKTNDPYEEIAVKVSYDNSKKITDAKIAGVYIHPDNWRSYPAKNLASQVIGFLSYNGNTFGPQYGLEKYYDKVLSSSNTGANVNFFAELFSGIKDLVSNKHSSMGTLVTTIEPTVQQFFQDILTDTSKTWSADNIGGIIMDPRTGEIISMGLVPTFDLNNFRTETDPSVFGNQNVQNVYEFGSVMKPIVMASAINEKLITKDTVYNDKGFVDLNGKKIMNYDKKGHGNVTMQEIMGKSLNTGMVYVQQLLGRDRFRDYLNSFGLSEKTGIDLPNEALNLSKNLNSKQDVDYATIAFGQGIALTPISAIRAFGALANDGKLVNPHIVKKIIYDNGDEEIVKLKPAVQTKISKETASETTRILVTDVDQFLINGKFKSEHYRVAAKTGTAQIPIANGKGYKENEYIHSFFGYFPAYDPKFIIFLYMVNPKNVDYSSATLTKPFMDTTKYLINYYKIPPDR